MGSNGMGVAEAFTPFASRATRDRLVLEHLPQAKTIAGRVHKNLPAHVNLDDLVHAGIIGLFDAASKYDPDKKVDFLPYARHRIKGSILDSLRELDWASRDLRRRSKQVEAVTRDLTTTLQRNPTEAEVAEKMGVEVERLREMMVDLRTRGLVSASTRRPQGEQDDLPAPDFPAGPELQPDRMTMQQHLRTVLADALETLPVRYKDVVLLYYVEDMTMREIGDKLGVKESRVSQIHKMALEKLADALGTKGITSSHHVTGEQPIGFRSGVRNTAPDEPPAACPPRNYTRFRPAALSKEAVKGAVDLDAVAQRLEARKAENAALGQQKKQQKDRFDDPSQQADLGKAKQLLALRRKKIEEKNESGLSLEDRLALELCYLDNIPSKLCAYILGIQQNSFSTKKSRALVRLARMLNRELDIDNSEHIITALQHLDDSEKNHPIPAGAAVKETPVSVFTEAAGGSRHEELVPYMLGQRLGPFMEKPSKEITRFDFTSDGKNYYALCGNGSFPSVKNDPLKSLVYAQRPKYQDFSDDLEANLGRLAHGNFLMITTGAGRTQSHIIIAPLGTEVFEANIPSQSLDAAVPRP